MRAPALARGHGGGGRGGGTWRRPLRCGWRRRRAICRRRRWSGRRVTGRRVGRGRRGGIARRRWTVVGRRSGRGRTVPGRGRGGREIRPDRGSEWIHALGRPKAGRRGRERTGIRRGRGPGSGRGPGRRTIPRRRRRRPRLLPGLSRGRGVRSWGGSCRRRRTPCGRRRRWRGRRGSAVCGRGGCRGERIAAGQAKLAGGLVRRAAPRAHDHVKTPELELCPAHARGQAPRAYPFYRTLRS